MCRSKRKEYLDFDRFDIVKNEKQWVADRASVRASARYFAGLKLRSEQDSGFMSSENSFAISSSVRTCGLTCFGPWLSKVDIPGAKPDNSPVLSCLRDPKRLP